VSGSPGALSPLMSVSHRACSARPVSVATATRRFAYPLKPSARLNRVTVAVEVPDCSARSTMLACAAVSALQGMAQAVAFGMGGLYVTGWAGLRLVPAEIRRR